MMQNILVITVLLAVGGCMPQIPKTGSIVETEEIVPDRLPTEEELEENKSAQYEFSSNIQDHINDLSHQRLEVRDGVNVKGMYSYSDGYFRRTVRYEADENGYRVTGEEVEPLDGPKIDLAGTASVDTAAHGTQLKYTLQSVAQEGEIVEGVSE